MIIGLIIICGCSQNRTKNEEVLSFSDWAIKELFENDNSKIKKINCIEINENSIMSGSNEIFVTDNNIYKYNTDKEFSNNTNCKLIGSINENKPIAVSQNNAIDEYGVLYNVRWQKINDKNYNGNYVKDTLTDGWREYFKRFKVNTNMISANDFFSGDEKRNIPYYNILTYVENELYAYYIDYGYPNGKEFKYKINIDEIGNEEILRLYGSFVKTNKSYYMINANIINKDMCEKYVDVDCEYSYLLKKDEILTKYYDEIMNITNDYFITKDYEMISVNDYINNR